MEYQILGSSMQMLKLKLQGGESIYADAGKIISKSSNVNLNAKLGGGGGFFKGVEMAFAGSSAFLIECNAEGEGEISLGGGSPGKISVLDLKEGESMYVDHSAFLGTTDPSKINVKASWRGGAIGAGMFLERFDGPCMVFLHVSGDIIEYDLTAGQSIDIEMGHIASFSGNMQPQISVAGGMKVQSFGKEGYYLASFTGPGKLIIQSVGSPYKAGVNAGLQASSNIQPGGGAGKSFGGGNFNIGGFSFKL